MAIEIVCGFPRDLPRGLLLLPDNDAVRDAALRLLPRSGAIFTPQTFTPKTFISTIEPDSGPREAIDGVRRVFLVKRLVQDDPEFASALHMTGLVQSLASLILTIRRAGIFSGKELLARLESNSPRHKRLARMLDGYADSLDKIDAIDGPAREHAAIESILSNESIHYPIPEGGVHALWFGDIMPDEARIIVAIARHADVYFYTPARADSPVGERLIRAANVAAQSIIEIAGELNVAVRFGKNGTISSPDALISAIASRMGGIDGVPASPFAGWPQLTALSARNPAEEASLLASAAKSLCIDHDVLPSDIAIFCDEPRLILRELREHGLPYRGGDERTFADGLSGELISRIIAAVASDFGRIELFSLLKHRLMRVESVERMDTAACSAGIVGGVPIDGAWIAGLEACEEPLCVKLIEQLRGLSDTIGGIGESRRISGVRFAETMERFFERFDIRNAIEEIAADSSIPIREAGFTVDSYFKILDLLSKFADAPPDSFVGHCALLLSLLSSEKPTDDGGKGIRILPISALGRTRCRIAILPNAVQGRLPGPKGEFLFLKKSEAVALGLTLPDGLMRGLFDILSILERAELTVVTRALAEGDRPLPPSPLLISLERALGENRDDYRRSMDRLASNLLARPFSERRRQIAAGELFTYPQSRFADLEDRFAGIESMKDAARATRIFRIDKLLPPDRFDGIVGTAFSNNLTKIAGKIGATSLDRYNRCPFAFFMEKVLGIEGIPEPEVELDRKTEGSVLHKTMELFWRNRIERFFGRTSLKQRLKKLAEMPEDAYSEIAVDSTNIDVAIEEIGAAIDVAISEIESWPGDFIKEDFERTLRRASTAYLEAVAVAEDRFIPIATELGIKKSFGDSEIFARVDRIDADSSGRIRIVDYKLSGAPSGPDIAALKAIQLPLYCVMLDAIAGMYWHDFSKGEPSEGGRFEREDHRPAKNSDWHIPVELWSVRLAEFTSYAEMLLEKMASGEFPPRPAGGKCPEWCAFAEICGYDPARPLPKGWPDDG